MFSSEPKDSHITDGQKAFLTTRWSMVVRAGDLHAVEARQALDSLCRDYWKPLFDFARRKGHLPEDAQDLTQGFIEHILETNSLAKANRERGRFRTFLLASFCNYIIGQHREKTALKRGGLHAGLTFDGTVSAHEIDAELWEKLTPERVYERSLAVALLERVLQRLQAECERAGRADLFTAIAPHLAGGGGRPRYGEVARALGMTESAVAVTVHRLRKRYGLLLREEIAAIVATPGEIEDELRYLMAVVADPAR